MKNDDEYLQERCIFTLIFDHNSFRFTLIFDHAQHHHAQIHNLPQTTPNTRAQFQFYTDGGAKSCFMFQENEITLSVNLLHKN
ncbi:MAG: hypothetical protein DWQ10_10710 [Calditrichaeota bacterium]|nr:MAG: hypothetical protein DWQ10_10710 [Calditrichota bacterium]